MKKKLTLLLSILVFVLLSTVPVLAKEKVYVVDSITLTANGETSLYRSFTYSKNGLVTSYRNHDRSKRVCRYKYSKNNIVEAEYLYDLSTGLHSEYTNTFHWKNGLMTQVTHSMQGVKPIDYIYKAKTLTKIKDNTSGSESKFTFDKNGRTKKIKSGTGQNGYTITYKYDSNGFLLSEARTWKSGSQSKTTYTNTYKKGRLVKKVETAERGNQRVFTFTYKKVKVSKKYLDQISAQQKILSDRLYFGTSIVLGFIVD